MADPPPRDSLPPPPEPPAALGTHLPADVRYGDANLSPGDQDQEPFAAGTRVRRHARRRWYHSPFVLIVLVTAVAGGMRFYRLSDPHGFVFDEVYYAKDACFDAGFRYQACGLSGPSEQSATVHPPLGRWIITAGVKLFSHPGDFDCGFSNQRPTCHPFGFRVMAAIFGTLSVLLLAILAYRLFRSSLWAGAAGLLLATENLNFVQSRVAMLDIFLTTFVVAGFLFLVLDREWIERRTPGSPPRTLPHEDADEGDLLQLPADRPPAPIARPWRIAAGVAFGAAAATKWSGAPALLGALVLTLVWEVVRREGAGVRHAFWETIRDEGFGMFVFLVLVPLAVYVASFARFWADNGARLGAFWSLQRQMANYSIHLRASHPYASRAWSWLLLKRPVDYYYAGDTLRNTSAEILAVGNPLVFWGSIFTIPYMLWAALKRADWRAGLIFVAFAAQYVPWLFAARTLFLFYMAPMTPFMVLALVFLLRDLSDVEIGLDRTRALRPLAALLALIAVAMFVFFFPVLTGRTIPYDAWRLRMWFQACSPKATWCWI